MPMDSRRVPTVPVDSSQASSPWPGRTIAFAVCTSSSLYLARFAERVVRADERAEGATRALAVAIITHADFILERGDGLLR